MAGEDVWNFFVQMTQEQLTDGPHYYYCSTMAPRTLSQGSLHNLGDFDSASFHSQASYNDSRSYSETCIDPHCIWEMN